MSVKRFLLGFIFASLAACSQFEVPALNGTYASAKKSTLQSRLAWLQNISSPLYDTLQLKSDSTCVFQNCSMSAEGYWKYRRDTVLVYYTKKRYNIDSLNNDTEYSRFLKCDTIPYKFNVQKKGKVLTCTIKYKDGETFLSDLEKIDVGH